MVLSLGVAPQAMGFGDEPSPESASTASAAVAPAAPDTASVRQAKLRIAASIGMGYIYSASQDADATSKKLSDDLRAGRDLQISGAVMVDRDIGVGVVYSNFSSSASAQVSGFVNTNYGQEAVTGNVSVDSKISFLGAMASTRTAVSGVGFHGAAALGRTSFESTSFGMRSGSLEGTGLGILYVVGLEIYLKPRVALALDVNGLRSTVDCSAEGLSESVKNDVSRIGASAGLHFYL